MVTTSPDLYPAPTKSYFEMPAKYSECMAPISIDLSRLVSEAGFQYAAEISLVDEITLVPMPKALAPTPIERNSLLYFATPCAFKKFTAVANNTNNANFAVVFISQILRCKENDFKRQLIIYF